MQVGHLVFDLIRLDGSDIHSGQYCCTDNWYAPYLSAVLTRGMLGTHVHQILSRWTSSL